MDLTAGGPKSEKTPKMTFFGVEFLANFFFSEMSVHTLLMPFLKGLDTGFGLLGTRGFQRCFSFLHNVSGSKVIAD